MKKLEASFGMKKNLTVRDIAQVAGVHFTTVALALKDDPRIKESTRRRIRDLAREMGYEPAPLVSALSRYRQAKRPASFHGVIAWLSNEAQPVLNEDYYFSRYVEGAREQAAKLGYLIEEFPFLVPGMTATRYGQILRARGVSGILVGPQPAHRMGARIKMDWSPFSAVIIGQPLIWPRLHGINNYHFQSAGLAIRHLVTLGYRRIGFWMDRRILGRVEGAWLGGYLSEMARRKMPHPEPVIFDPFESDFARRWASSERPDALITLPEIAERFAESCGLRIPEDLGVANLHLHNKVPGWAGIDQSDEEIGAEAAKWLVNMMHLRERGIPALPKRMMVEGRWRDGPSVRTKQEAEDI